MNNANYPIIGKVGLSAKFILCHSYSRDVTQFSITGVFTVKDGNIFALLLHWMPLKIRSIDNQCLRILKTHI